MSSLRNRLSLALALVLLAAGALLAFGLQQFPSRLVEGYVQSRLEHDADLLYARVHDTVDATQAEEAVRGAAGTVYNLPLSGHYFRIVRGEQVIRSRSLWDEDLAADATGPGHAASSRLAGPAGQTLLAIERRYRDAAGEWRILVAEDVGRVDAAIDAFRRWLLGGVALSVALLLWLQRRLIVRGLAPLDEAVEACRRLERGETARIDAPAPDEVAPMIDAVNRLVHHQAQRLSRIRHAAGNLSHALKTPLTVLGQAADEAAARGDAELAGAMRSQIDTMRGTIERELNRARLAGAGAPGEGFDARAQLESLVSVLQRLHADRSLAIEVLAPDVRLPIDREDMLELFGNLLDNACKWARTRVRIELELADTGRGAAAAADARDARTSGALAFRVEDDGPGVSEPLLERLGTAGARADESLPGHGLGLAIVGDIVAQYGGTIGYRRSESLGGLRVDGRLPIAGSISPPA